LEHVLCPVLIPIHSLDKTIVKLAGQSHYRGAFTVQIDAESEALLTPGRTGKFVPQSYREGGVWRELAKGRILSVDRTDGIATGEIYTGAAGKKAEIEKAVLTLSETDFLEIDQYGASAKVLSGLVEYSLVQILRRQGYTVLRMPRIWPGTLACMLTTTLKSKKRRWSRNWKQSHFGARIPASLD
jgi:hypothetical protein